MSKTVTIAILGTSSGAAGSDISVESFVGLQTDSAFTTSAITFTTCQTVDGTFVPLKVEGGGAYTITGAVASAYYALDYTKFLGARYIKVVTDAQVAQSVVTLYSRLIK